eukprot:Em0002g1322a
MGLYQQTEMLKLRILSLHTMINDRDQELRALHDHLKVVAAELEAAKEEVAVKVAQVKQYQKQVEAYKKQNQDHTTILEKEKAKYNRELTDLRAQLHSAKENPSAIELQRHPNVQLNEAQAVNLQYQKQVHMISFLEGLDQRLEKGRGSYGAVYEVKLNGLPCIAKGLHEILLGLGGNVQVAETDIQAIRQKFLNECVLMSKLKHPNIVQFLGVHSTKDNEYLVMEYMHMDLAECLDTYHDIPASIKVSILHDVSHGLLHLHSQDPPIIHRDLTATNILLTQDMRAKIADLGVSRLFDVQHLHSAPEQTMAPGTTAYMPPEALHPDPKYDLKFDIFSFGVLSLYAAIQEFPIAHEQLTTAVVRKQEVQIYRRKHWIEKMGMDHFLHPLVIKCLQDRPELRPTTKELCGMIGRVLPQNKKEWKNVLELHRQVQILKSESDQHIKQLEVISRNDSPQRHRGSSASKASTEPRHARISHNSDDDLPPPVMLPKAHHPPKTVGHLPQSSRPPEASQHHSVGAGRRIASMDIAFDPNLVCPVCQRMFKKGETHLYRQHVELCQAAGDKV